MCGVRVRDRAVDRAAETALFGLLPVLQRLRSRLNSFQIGIHAVRPRRIVRLLRGRFLAAGLLLRAAFLALALALALLL